MSRAGAFFSLLLAWLLLNACEKAEQAGDDSPRVGVEEADRLLEEDVLSGVVIPDGFRTFEAPAWGAGVPGVKLELPESWRHEIDRGLDFDVHWFRAPEGKGYLGVFVGLDPIWRPSEESEGSDEMVGRRHVPFYRTDRDGETYLTGLADGMFAGEKNSVGSDLRLHFMIRARDENVLAAARQGMRSLRTVASAREEVVPVDPALLARRVDQFNTWGVRHADTGWRFEATALHESLNFGSGFVTATSPSGWVYMSDSYQVRVDGVIEFHGSPLYYPGNETAVRMSESAVIRIHTKGSGRFLEIVDGDLHWRIPER